MSKVSYFTHAKYGVPSRMQSRENASAITADSLRTYTCVMSAMVG